MCCFGRCVLHGLVYRLCSCQLPLLSTTIIPTGWFLCLSSICDAPNGGIDCWCLLLFRKTTKRPRSIPSITCFVVEAYFAPRRPIHELIPYGCTRAPSPGISGGLKYTQSVDACRLNERFFILDKTTCRIIRLMTLQKY